MKSFWLTSAALLIAASMLPAEEGQHKSGLQPGDKAGAYNVLDATGPNKGKKLCYR